MAPIGKLPPKALSLKHGALMMLVHGLRADCPVLDLSWTVADKPPVTGNTAESFLWQQKAPRCLPFVAGGHSDSNEVAAGLF